MKPSGSSNPHDATGGEAARTNRKSNSGLIRGIHLDEHAAASLVVGLQSFGGKVNRGQQK